MGDRGNIVIRHKSGTNSDDVWLYTHWSGSELPAILKTALARKQRWDDAPYLTRIIFCVLVGKYTGEETGYGISCSIGDNEHDILVVDVVFKTIHIIKEDDCKFGRAPALLPKAWGTFEEYINSPEKIKI